MTEASNTSFTKEFLSLLPKMLDGAALNKTKPLPRPLHTHLCLIDGAAERGALVQTLEGFPRGDEGWQLDPAGLHHARTRRSVTLAGLLGGARHRLQRERGLAASGGSGCLDVA